MRRIILSKITKVWKDLYLSNYNQYKAEFEQKSTEKIIAWYMTRNLLEKILCYIFPLAGPNAKKNAAKGTLKERIE